MSTGSVYQRRDGKWCAALQVAGKRRVVYGHTEGQAKRRLALLQTQCSITGRLPDPGRRTVGNLLDEWFKAAAFRPRTRAEYVALATRYVRPSLGHVRLSRLEPVHLQRLYASLEGRNLVRAPSQVHRLLHRALKVAVFWGWLSNNPANRVLPPAYTPPRKAVWAVEELRRFIDATSGHRMYPMWAILATTGMRIGELLALTWEDVDHAAGTVAVKRTLHRLRGQWVTSKPKTQAGQRTIALPPEAIRALRLQRVQQNEWRLAAGPAWQDTGLVFTTLTGRALHLKTVARALQAACTGAGVPLVTPHGFRHGHASVLLSANVPLTSVSARLGHASPAVTTRVYAHALASDDQRAAQAIGDVISGDR